MSVQEDSSRSPRERVVELFEADGEFRDGPRAVTAGLGLVAAVLVATSTLSAVEAGYAAVGASLLSAGGLFVATVAVFEAGRRLGAAD